MGNKKGDIIIDLTSLLDVIFILLLIIMCNQFTKITEYEDMSQTAMSTSASANAAKELYEQQLDTQDNINSYVYAVSIYSYYEPENITTRYLRVLREDEVIFEESMIGNNTDDAFTALEEELISYAMQYPDNPIIISLNENDENILYRDEQRIIDILLDVSTMEECSNVYIKGYLEE